MLWFDVGFKRYTTQVAQRVIVPMLWFDVGFKRYTTRELRAVARGGCGLM